MEGKEFAPAVAVDEAGSDTRWFVWLLARELSQIDKSQSQSHA